MTRVHFVSKISSAQNQAFLMLFTLFCVVYFSCPCCVSVCVRARVGVCACFPCGERPKYQEKTHPLHWMSITGQIRSDWRRVRTLTCGSVQYTVWTIFFLFKQCFYSIIYIYTTTTTPPPKKTIKRKLIRVLIR